MKVLWNIIGIVCLPVGALWILQGLKIINSGALVKLHNDDESLGAGPFRELELAKKYPELLKGLTDFELGELNGKLYMIRWVLSSKVLDENSLYET